MEKLTFQFTAEEVKALRELLEIALKAGGRPVAPFFTHLDRILSEQETQQKPAKKEEAEKPKKAK